MTDASRESMGRIEHLTQNLTRDVEPPTDLWPAIAAGIEPALERRIARLSRDIEAGRDLWPAIRPRLETRAPKSAARLRIAHPRFGLAAAAGLLAVASTALLLSVRVSDLTGRDGAGDTGVVPIVTTADVPPWMTDVLERFSGAAIGTAAAQLGETASLLRRDFLMLRSERLRIEQALADAPGDMNLRTQWRHVYAAELGLIDEAGKLANVYRMRREI